MFSLAPTSVYDVAHLLNAGVLVFSFALLLQRRLFDVIQVYRYQAMTLAAAAFWQAYTQNNTHLLLTGLIALGVNALVIPYALRRIIEKFDILRSTEATVGLGGRMALAIALVVLSIVLVFPIAGGSGFLSRESLTIALSVVLIGYLTIIVRRNVISQVVGFLSLENGLILAAVGVKGMPFVVEILIAFSVLVACILFGILFFHIREQFDSLDSQHLEQITGEQQK